MRSIDTETTGVDLRHGARPYFVSACQTRRSKPGGSFRLSPELLWWEWEINPLTREPMPLDIDLEEIKIYIEEADTLITHNGKFDYTALKQFIPNLEWPWDRNHDTLVAAHVLASNQPKDLTSLVLLWLGEDISPLEKKLEKYTKELRHQVKQSRLREKRTGQPDLPYGSSGEVRAVDLVADWRIADEGLEDMPSYKSGDPKKDPKWNYDCWLLREDRKQALRDYALADAEYTLALWPVMEAELKRRDLWEIYLTRLHSMRLAWQLEENGLTMSLPQLNFAREQYAAEASEMGTRCVQIAADRGFDLTLPKGGRNKSLEDFCFKILKLPIVKWTEGGNPGLDAKETIPHWIATLPEGDAVDFLKSLVGKRSRDTAVTYMNGYERFMLPTEDDDWRILHPSINPTGPDTLRWSSSNPNETNISKKEDFNLRQIFGPMPGREWWSFDFQNLELRIPAYEADEREMIELFERPNDPPYFGSMHLLNFHTVYPDIWEKEIQYQMWKKDHIKNKYKSTYYQWDKNGGFSKQYGGQRDKVDATFHRDGAFDLIESRFSAVAGLNKSVSEFADKHGYVETMPDKTVNPRRGYPLMTSRNEWGRVKPTIPLAYHVSGTAMWCTLKAMIRTNRKLGEWKTGLNRFDGKMIIYVHDELVFDFPRAADPRKDPKRSNLWRALLLKKEMEKSGDDIGVPTPVSIEWHPDNWSEGVGL